MFGCIFALHLLDTQLFRILLIANTGTEWGAFDKQGQITDVDGNKKNADLQ